MLVNRKFDVTAIAVLALGVAAYAAFQPRLRLRPDMPPEFFDAAGVTLAKKAADRKLAEAYWKCAVTEIQWKYGYAHRLPDDPPAEFSLTVSQVGVAANDESSRIRYWQKVRQVWFLPSVWKEDYGLDLSSMKRSFESAGGWLEDRMWRLTGSR
jgi:hypothetical protein